MQLDYNEKVHQELALWGSDPEKAYSVRREWNKKSALTIAMRQEAAYQERVDEEGCAPVFAVLKVALWEGAI